MNESVMCNPKVKLMRSTLIIILIVIAGGCTNKHVDQTSIDNFDWLVGQWERTNEETGKTTIESWTKNNDLEYHGNSFTLQNNDTVWQENVRLKKQNETWIYEVTQKGDSLPTPFTLTHIGEESFVCENKLNEFPKNISYNRNVDKIIAEISGGDTKILFDFKKVE
jgi:hypothetical protein